MKCNEHETIVTDVVILNKLIKGFIALNNFQNPQHRSE